MKKFGEKNIIVVRTMVTIGMIYSEIWILRHKDY